MELCALRVLLVIGALLSINISLLTTLPQMCTFIFSNEISYSNALPGDISSAGHFVQQRLVHWTLCPWTGCFLGCDPSSISLYGLLVVSTVPTGLLTRLRMPLNFCVSNMRAGLIRKSHEKYIEWSGLKHLMLWHSQTTKGFLPIFQHNYALNV